MHGDEIEAREVSVDDESVMKADLCVYIDHHHINFFPHPHV